MHTEYPKPEVSNSYLQVICTRWSITSQNDSYGLRIQDFGAGDGGEGLEWSSPIGVWDLVPEAKESVCNVEILPMATLDLLLWQQWFLC